MATINAATVISFVRQATADGGVVTWAELRDEFPDTKRLRNVARGLVRNGDIGQDRGGNYYLADGGGSSDLARGSVVGASSEMGGRLAIRPLGAGLIKAGASKRVAVPDLPLTPPNKDKGTRRTPPVREGDEVSYLTVDTKAGAQTAQIIEVLKHSANPIIGAVVRSRFGPVVDSLSPGFRGKVQLDSLPADVNEGDTVTVRVTGNDRFGLRGDVTGVVSRGDVADAAAVTLIASNGIPEDFSAEGLALADALPRVVQPGRFRSRTDLQALSLVTIDGADARDFDDAVYAEATADGGWRLVVAIADVAHYVKPGSALDNDAFERGNSVYLPDRVIPMLPESLSNGLCSLRPNEPRLSLVCDMRISRRGNIDGFEFYDAVICSWARLTYSQVSDYFTRNDPLPVDKDNSQALKAGRTIDATVAGVQSNVDELRKVFGALLKAREARGALEFETRTGVLSLHEGRVRDIREVVRNDAHRLIEEAMISANVCAAKFISQQDAHALYRVHEPPQASKADVMRDALAYVGIRVRDVPSDPKELATLLAPLAGRKDAWLLYSLILRSMSQARYQPENCGHFGLALTDYMHFTSPIRRYPDLIVHRVIKALVHGKRAPLQSMDKLLQAGEHLSSTERRAEDCERGVSNWLKCDFVASRVGETFAGIVVGVQDFGLFVELDGYFVQGLVHISSLGDDYFNYQPQSLSLVGERSGRTYGLGDTMDVVLVDVQAPQGKLDLIPLANYRSAKRSAKSRERGSQRKSGKSDKKKGKRS